MIREFLVWWLGQLPEFLPERWRRVGSRDGDALIIAPVAPLSEGFDAVAVSLRRNEHETTLGHYRLDPTELAQIPRPAGKPVTLRLAQSDVLAKTLVLPIAAERELQQVLAFEMDRETPFGADEVFWTHRVARRDRRTGRIWVRLLLVQKAKLLGLIDALDQAGVHPGRAELGAGPDHSLVLPLDNGEQRSHAPARRWVLWPATACFVVLAVTAVALPFIQQAEALADTDREIASDRLAVAEAERITQEIQNLSASADLIEAERAKNGQPLAILATLTQLLPADTYLTDLIQQQRKITITGRSAAASRLIPILAGGDQLRNPSFAAPVTRVEANQSEIFTITAEVAP